MSDELGDHFRGWLRAGMTGCSYAAALAAKGGRLALATHVAPPRAAELDRYLDVHGEAERVAIIVLPFVTSEPGLVDVLNGLRRGSSRWKLRHAGTAAHRGVLVGLDWTTANGDVCDTMGFAPFVQMPVPRRAPYVAIAAWPGGRSNRFRGERPTPRARPGQVSFLDAAHDFSKEQYEKAWAATEATVATLMNVPPDDPRRYRRVAFVLDAAAAAALAFDA